MDNLGRFDENGLEELNETDFVNGGITTWICFTVPLSLQLCPTTGCTPRCQ